MSELDFGSLLKTAMGFDSTSVGGATVERAVALRMAGLGIKRLEDYWQRVTSSRDEFQELIESVVVPETWFFRDPVAFTALVWLVYEQWLPAHPTGVLNLLSAPCSSGEEPYSMAMALLNAGLPVERFKIDAVDISMRAIAAAKCGTYRENSFRGENLEFRDRHFEQASHGYRVAKSLHDTVSFHYGNLLAPDFRIGPVGYDVIFCRNLLIYFDKATQQHLLKTLGALLAPNGILFVGPAEAFVVACNGFKAVPQSVSFAFRKADSRSASRKSAAQPKTKKTSKGPGRQDVRPRHKPHVAAAPADSPTVQASVDLDTVCRLADTGRLAEAVALCQVHLREHGASPEAYYVLGLSLDASGNAERAIECYRKVLYLKPDHTEALLHLAAAFERSGNTATAARLRERARRTESAGVK